MLEVMAKIMLLIGLGGLVGLLAYHQFKTQGLQFRPLVILGEVGLALKKAALAAVRLVKLAWTRFQGWVLRAYTLVHPSVEKFSQGLQGTSRRTVQSITQSSKKTLQALGQVVVRSSQGLAQNFKGLTKKDSIRVIRRKGPAQAVSKQAYDKLLREQPPAPRQSQTRGLEPVQRILARRRQELQPGPRLPSRPQAEPESSKWSQDILKQKEIALLKQVSARPKDISLYKRLGFLYVELGLRNEARQAFETALRLGSQDSEIKKQLEKL